MVSTDENLYPNDGEYFSGFREPKSQRQEREKEEMEVKANSSAFDKVVGHFEERIAFYDSVSSVPDDALSDSTLFMNTIAANKQTKANLQRELEVIKSMVDTFK